LNLDCQGHDASSIELFDVGGGAVRNCLMHGTAAMADGVLQNLSVEGSSHVTVDSSNVMGQVSVSVCQSCTFSSDTFAYPADGFNPSDGDISCELCLEGGQSNTVVQSTVDGGSGDGIDDAILLVNEGNSVLEGNTIRNVFDAGIESSVSTGPVTATIQGNTISNAGFTGIGGYYIPGWQNSVFSGNTVSNTPDLLLFIAPPAATTSVTMMTLVNNQITNNVLVNPITAVAAGGQLEPSIVINYVGNPEESRPYTVTGNVLRNNNLGTSTPGPMLSPASGFIDGGGNICGPGGTLLMCSAGGAVWNRAAPLGRLFLPPTPAPRPPSRIRRR